MENKRIFNRQQQKLQRQQLRANMPMPEKILWVKFRRQHGIGRYIVDFYCPEWALVIELDGDSHYQDGAQEYDAMRDEFMRSMGIHVLRFTNVEVMNNLETAVMKIYERLK
jgi:very-short-patch-repair endonuclease